MAMTNANDRRRNAHWLGLLGLLLLATGRPGLAGQGILFECQRPDRPPSYLLGTMHADDPRILAVAESVREPLRSVRRLILEMVPDGPAMLAAMLAGVLPRGQTLHDLLTPELYASTMAAMAARGVPAELAERMRPWAVALELSLPAGERGAFLDLHLYQLAEEAGLEVVGLESAAEQLSLFDDLTEAQQVSLLASAVKNLPLVSQQYEAMVAAYLDGDLQALQRLTEAQQDDLGADLADWFEHTMVEQRNLRMAERLRPWLDQGGALVAVGALHLVGDTGLLATLGRAGCEWRVLR